jgi:hypothetical protein
MENEITNFNNVAHTTLPKAEEASAAPKPKKIPVSSGGRGRR